MRVFFGLASVCLLASCFNFDSLDTGGGCTLVGSPCAATADCCTGLLCTAGKCVTPTTGVSCTNNRQDGSETDVDCGGTCSPCQNARHCKVKTDCQSALCQNLVCTAPTTGNCNNGIRDGAETDVDCGGGSCPTCALSRMCVHASDCASANCVNQLCTPGTTNPTCNDGIQNGGESDVDCGGSSTCVRCANGRMCTFGSDCTSNNCVNNLCKVSTGPTCFDNTQNGNETDVDCGGGTCPKCSDGFGCTFASDCTSNNCVNNVCQAVAQTYGCVEFVNCARGCAANDQTCVDDCFNMINTANGQTVVNNFLNCIDTACPSTGGGPCDPANVNEATACPTCVNAAQAAGGRCATQTSACSKDG